MVGWITSALVCIGAVGTSWSATYTVTKTDDSGHGTLRWAIRQANATPGPHLITFAPGLSGQTIRPVSVLPAITQNDVQVTGDLDNDGHPDVTLDGAALGAGSGLTLRGSNDRVAGLAITNFPSTGVVLCGANGCVVEHCHLGVTCEGHTVAANHTAGVRLSLGTGHLVRWNVIAGAISTHSCVYITGGSNSHVAHNYCGVDVEGDNPLAKVNGCGVEILADLDPNVQSHRVEANVFGGLFEGVIINGSDNNTVQGNLFGLTANGNTTAPLVFGVKLLSGARGNQIGGSTAAKRNVFVGWEGSSWGVYCIGGGVLNNRVQGNYFGCNRAGNTRAPLNIGVYVGYGAGAQTIGGNTAATRNYINVDPFQPTAIGVRLDHGGNGTKVHHNTFGRLPDGALAPTAGKLVEVYSSTDVSLRNNEFANGYMGVGIDSITPDVASARIYDNLFRNCTIAVDIGANGRAYLGNLGNARTDDDGGNTFRNDNPWYWYVKTKSALPTKAEGNDWGTTMASAIDYRIWDHLDNTSLGRVDFDPLLGGVHPTGETLAGLHLTGACATRTRAGAEIAFTLSAPAEVTVEVVNLAGRPVATVARNLPTDAGTQRVLWNGCSDTGLRAPSGRYLIEIVARNALGNEARALTALP